MLCRLENTENGKTKFISLPKSEERMASMLEDIGVTAKTNEIYKVSYIGIHRPELAKKIMEMGLSPNLYINFYDEIKNKGREIDFKKLS